jgi:hypothetical protein
MSKSVEPEASVSEREEAGKSCFSGKNILCTLRKPKSPEATRARYKGIFYGSVTDSMHFLHTGSWILRLSWSLVCVVVDFAKRNNFTKQGAPRLASDPNDAFVTATDLFLKSYLSIELAAKREAELVSRAESIAYDEEHNDMYTTIQFRINLHVEFGERVCLIGSVRELGEWDVDSNAISLTWSESDIWQAEVKVKRADVARLEYKYVVLKADGKVRWESGGNHNVLKKPERRITQDDFWEFPGYNCRV